MLFRCIICLLLVISSTSCGLKVQGVDIGRVFEAAGKVGDFGEKDQAEEIRIGTDTAISLLDEAKISPRENLQAYVNKVGYWLVKHTTRPDLPWRFIVLENTAINAFAAPGGYIFITTGMLSSLNNEAELAGVLAHEIGHVLLKHHMVAIQEKSKSGFLMDLAVLGAQVGNATTANNRGERSGPDISEAFDKTVTNLYFNGLDRQDEIEADRIGVMLAAKAGYDPYGFVSVLQVIGSREGLEEAELKRFARTHPKTEDRLIALEEAFVVVDNLELSNRVLSSQYSSNLYD